MIKPLHIMLSPKIRMDKKMERSLDSLSAVNEESSNVFSITSSSGEKYNVLCYKMPHASSFFPHSFFCPVITFFSAYFVLYLLLDLVASLLSTATK